MNKLSVDSCVHSKCLDSFETIKQKIVQRVSLLALLCICSAPILSAQESTEVEELPAPIPQEANSGTQSILETNSAVETGTTELESKKVVAPPVANPPQLEPKNSSVEALSGSSTSAPSIQSVGGAPASPPPPPKPIVPDKLPDSMMNALLTPKDPGASEPDYEVLLQGAIHEAFGVPADSSLATTEAIDVVAPKVPPQPILETPPAEVPPGNNVNWIPGYWNWDQDRGDFVWISGMYRDIPPGRTWVAGVWQQNSNGTFTWHRGYWAVTGVENPTYLPPPPTPAVSAPSTPAPNDSSFWLPGEWVYQNNQYQWQAGYWTEQYQDWVWEPSCYVNTPRGYVYVAGYWDYEPAIRGIPYAPIYFSSPVYLTSGFSYRPIFPIARPSSLLLHLFVRPGYRSYYFGDYYGNRYSTVGYQPWYSVSRTTYHSASLLSYYQWKYGSAGISFADSMLRYRSYFVSNPGVRPTTTISIGPSIATVRSAGAAARITALNTLPSKNFASSFDSIVRNTINGAPAPRLSSRNLPSTVTTAVPSLRGGNLPSSQLRSSVTNLRSSFPRTTITTPNARTSSASATQALRSRRSIGNSVSLESLLRSTAVGNTDELAGRMRPSTNQNNSRTASGSRANPQNPRGPLVRQSPTANSRSSSATSNRTQPNLPFTQVPSVVTRSGSVTPSTSSSNRRNSISSRSMFPQGQERVFFTAPTTQNRVNPGVRLPYTQAPNNRLPYTRKPDDPRGTASIPSSRLPGMRTNSRAGVQSSRANVVNSRSNVVNSRDPRSSTLSSRTPRSMAPINSSRTMTTRSSSSRSSSIPSSSSSLRSRMQSGSSASPPSGLRGRFGRQ